MRNAAVLLLAPALLGSVCPRIDTLELRLDEGSPPDRPAFDLFFGETPLPTVGEFAVTHCRPQQLRSVVWQIQRVNPPRSEAPLRITYGRTPPGFRHLVAPRPLAPGCYQALATTPSAGSLTFRVLSDTLVAEGGGWEGDMRAERQIERAAIRCVRRYRRARSGSDTLAVDQAVHAVSDTTVTCVDLRTRWPALLTESVSSERQILESAVGIAALIALLAATDALDTKSPR